MKSKKQKRKLKKRAHTQIAVSKPITPNPLIKPPTTKHTNHSHETTESKGKTKAKHKVIRDELYLNPLEREILKKSKIIKQKADILSKLETPSNPLWKNKHKLGVNSPLLITKCRENEKNTFHSHSTKAFQIQPTPNPQHIPNTNYTPTLCNIPLPQMNNNNNNIEDNNTMTVDKEFQIPIFSNKIDEINNRIITLSKINQDNKNKIFNLNVDSKQNLIKKNVSPKNKDTFKKRASALSSNNHTFNNTPQKIQKEEAFTYKQNNHETNLTPITNPLVTVTSNFKLQDHDIKREVRTSLPQKRIDLNTQILEKCPFDLASKYKPEFAKKSSSKTFIHKSMERTKSCNNLHLKSKTITGSFHGGQRKPFMQSIQGTESEFQPNLGNNLHLNRYTPSGNLQENKANESSKYSNAKYKKKMTSNISDFENRKGDKNIKLLMDNIGENNINSYVLHRCISSFTSKDTTPTCYKPLTQIKKIKVLPAEFSEEWIRKILSSELTKDEVKKCIEKEIKEGKRFKLFEKKLLYERQNDSSISPTNKSFEKDHKERREVEIQADSPSTSMNKKKRVKFQSDTPETNLFSSLGFKSFHRKSKSPIRDSPPASFIKISAKTPEENEFEEFENETKRIKFHREKIITKEDNSSTKLKRSRNKKRMNYVSSVPNYFEKEKIENEVWQDINVIGNKIPYTLRSNNQTIKIVQNFDLSPQKLGDAIHTENSIIYQQSITNETEDHPGKKSKTRIERSHSWKFRTNEDSGRFKKDDSNNKLSSLVNQNLGTFKETKSSIDSVETGKGKRSVFIRHADRQGYLPAIDDTEVNEERFVQEYEELMKKEIMNHQEIKRKKERKQFGVNQKNFRTIQALDKILWKHNRKKNSPQPAKIEPIKLDKKGSLKINVRNGPILNKYFNNFVNLNKKVTRSYVKLQNKDTEDEKDLFELCQALQNICK